MVGREARGEAAGTAGGVGRKGSRGWRDMVLTSSLLLVVVVCVVTTWVTAASSAITAPLPVFDDSVIFDIQWTKPPHNAELYESVPMLTSLGESYTCYVPKAEHDDDDEAHKSSESDRATTPPHPRQLLSDMEDECFFRLEGYWSYEFCFGRHVRQFHEEKVPTSSGSTRTQVTEYFLGRQSTSAGARAMAAPATISTMVFEGEERKYYSEVYENGDACDLTGRGRRTEARFVCGKGLSVPEGVVQVEETSTCNYMLVFASRALCQSQEFKQEEDPVHPIVCTAPEEAPSKPQRQRDIDDEIRHLVEQAEARVKESRAAQRTNKMVLNSGGGVAFGDLEGTEQPLSAGQQQQQQQQQQKQGRPSSAQRKQQQQRSTTAATTRGGGLHLAKRMVEGSYCFRGGGRAWWRFEYCPGKHVMQFHQYEDGSVDKVHLGYWEEAEHRRRYRVRQPDAGQRPTPRQITQYYVGGDYCEAAKVDREVTVRLLCRTSMGADQVHMSLEEDPKCKYTLTLRSRAACELLHVVDAEGVFSLAAAAAKEAGREGSGTPTGKETKEREQEGNEEN